MAGELERRAGTTGGGVTRTGSKGGAEVTGTGRGGNDGGCGRAGERLVGGGWGGPTGAGTVRARVGWVLALGACVALLLVSGCASGEPAGEADVGGAGSSEAEAPAGTRDAGGATRAGSHDGNVPAESDPEIVVGYQDYGEVRVLAELYAQALERAGFEVEREFVFQDAVEGRVERGDLDLVPRYARPPDQAEPSTEDGLKELEPARNANTRLVLLTTRYVVEEYGIRDAADLARYPDLPVTNPYYEPGGNPEDPLKRLYELAEEANPDRIFYFDVDDAGGGSPYLEFARGEPEAVTLGLTTDGEIEEYDLVALEDRQGIVEAGDYYPVPYVGEEYLEETPRVAEVLDPLSENLRIEDLRTLDLANDSDEGSALEAAVEEYLEENQPPGA